MRRADPPRDGVPAHSTAPLEFVQAFRGIAALLVVLWHASIFLGPYGTGLGGRLFGSGGSMGVDLFFLISGFIMVHTTRGSDGSWRDAAVFAIKRAARIWPVWIVAAALFVLCKPEPRAFVLEPANRSWLLFAAVRANAGRTLGRRADLRFPRARRRLDTQLRDVLLRGLRRVDAVCALALACVSPGSSPPCFCCRTPPDIWQRTRTGPQWLLPVERIDSGCTTST